jgi:hypothetical protein
MWLVDETMEKSALCRVEMAARIIGPVTSDTMGEACAKARTSSLSRGTPSSETRASRSASIKPPWSPARSILSAANAEFSFQSGTYRLSERCWHDR